MNKRSWATISVGALVLATMLGCAAQIKPVMVDLVYQQDVPPELSAAEFAASEKCQLGIIGIVDDRTNKETLGTTNTAIFGTGFMDWARDGFASLETYGYPLQDPVKDASAFAGVAIHVTLQKVYCRAQPDNLRGVIVASVRFEGSGATLGQRVYRGGAVKSKSAFSSSDYKFSDRAVLHTLNQAMDDVVSQIEADIRGFCSDMH